MAMALRFLLLAVVAVVVYRAIRGLLSGGGGGAGSGFACGTCANCGQVFDDGVICRFGGKETFKNETHIANCHDYRRRTG